MYILHSCFELPAESYFSYSSCFVLEDLALSIVMVEELLVEELSVTSSEVLSSNLSVIP